MSSQEGEEAVHLLIKRHGHVNLLQLVRCPTFCILVHTDHLRTSQCGSPQALHGGPKCGRKQESLPLGGEVPEDVMHGLLKAKVQDPVGLIEDKHLQAPGLKPWRLIQMLEKTSRCRDQYAHSHNAFRLLLDRTSADDAASGELMLLSYGREHLKDLIGQLSGGRHHERPQAVHLVPAAPEQKFQSRQQESQRLARARPSLAQDVAAREGPRDGAALDLCHPGKFPIGKTLLCPLRDRQIPEQMRGQCRTIGLLRDFGCLGGSCRACSAHLRNF
mmetsp:Transcript_22681/g.77453  ORF Transcript_22681/g.77453 Transcript_22681/m.77453 type:complete len:274 (+) Transcript_22681:1579-2400(+)